MTDLKDTNIDAWTRAKTIEVAQFAEQKLGVPDLVSRLVLKISSKKKARSRGGIKMIKGNFQPWISLNVGKFVGPLSTGKTVDFVEYKSIAKHPVIGSVYSTSPKVAITTLIVHEMAHAIDYYTNPRWGFDIVSSKKIDSKLNMSYSWADGRHRLDGGHGARWQAIYALLRIQFVNDGVSDPEFEEVQKTPKKQRAKPILEIVTKRLRTSNGSHIVQYIRKGEIVAIGRRWGNRFRIYTTTPNGQVIDAVCELSDGRGARRWIRENCVFE